MVHGQGSHSPYILGDTTRARHITLCPRLIEIGSKTAEKNAAQTNKQTDRQTDRHYENNGHLAVNSQIIWKLQNNTTTSLAGCVWVRAVLRTVTLG